MVVEVEAVGAMTFPDDLRAAASDPTVVSDLPGMLTAAAWRIDQDGQRIDRLVTDMARVQGVSEAAVRVRYGLGDPNASRSCERPDSACEAARITPVSLDPVGWYGDDHGWADRDDAHRVTFEGESA